MSIGTLMRGAIELDGDERTKPGIANHEVDMLGSNTIKIALPIRVVPVRFDKIS